MYLVFSVLFFYIIKNIFLMTNESILTNFGYASVV